VWSSVASLDQGDGAKCSGGDERGSGADWGGRPIEPWGRAAKHVSQDERGGRPEWGVGGEQSDRRILTERDGICAARGDARCRTKARDKGAEKGGQWCEWRQEAQGERVWGLEPWQQKAPYLLSSSLIKELETFTCHNNIIITISSINTYIGSSINTYIGTSQECRSV
jgi:hypothetical protein